MNKNEHPPTPPTPETNGPNPAQDPWFTSERIEALKGPASIVVPGEGKLSQTGTLAPVEIEGYERTDYEERAVYNPHDLSNDKEPVGYETEPHHYLRFRMEDGTPGWKEVEHFSFSEERKQQLEDEGFILDPQIGNITVPSTQQGEKEDTPSTSYQPTDDEPTTTEMPVVDDSTPTEEMPVEGGGQDGTGPEDDSLDSPPGSEGRWARFKRGVRKHLHETPIDMTPMGPPIQPDIPFDEWYAQKLQEGPGRLERAADKAAEKIGGVAEQTAENMAKLTKLVDYAGNIALINTADAVTLTAKRVAVGMENATRKVDDTGNVVLMGMGYHVASAKEKAARRARQLAGGAGRLTRKTDDAGNAAMEGAALGVGITASVIADQTGKFTHKMDEAGQAALERMAPAADKSAELAGKTTRKTDYMGQVLLNQMVAYGSDVSTNVKRRMGHPSTWPEEEKKQFKDWQENWDWTKYWVE